MTGYFIIIQNVKHRSILVLFTHKYVYHFRISFLFFLFTLCDDFIMNDICLPITEG